jgi:predicted ATPase with chaperone activity
MDDSLLNRLFRKPGNEPKPSAAEPAADSPAAVLEPPPVEPAYEPPPKNEPEKGASDAKLASLLQRIQQLTTTTEGVRESHEPIVPLIDPEDEARQAQSTVVNEQVISDEFIPREPKNLREAGLTESEVESLILKYLLARGDAAGRDVAELVRLPFGLLDEMMRQMKFDQLLVYRGTSQVNDYIYQLTDLGRERARRLVEHCSYYGAAPVPLKDYIDGVGAQSLTKQHPTQDDLLRAFDDLLINKRMLTRLGPAINSGRGMFLFGPAGNGKTSIAERVTRAFGQFIWIPRAIGIDGEIIRLYDPNSHEEAPLPPNTALWDGAQIDKRWIRIRRPTIVTGGELQMENLEVTINTSTGISEAPVQLKSNCGTLVIDDFGRQKMSIDTLLNRWIVPLEKRYDFLNLPNGKKIQVPFDQLIVFSTNLEPKDLVDEAFLRRIPYKIEVIDPTEEEFRELFKIMCPKLGFEYDDKAIDYVVEKHYRKVSRKMRCCQPRDLLQQVKNHCLYQNQPLKLSPEYFDLAVENYFAIM